MHDRFKQNDGMTYSERYIAPKKHVYGLRQPETAPKKDDYDPRQPETWPEWVRRHVCNQCCIPMATGAISATGYIKKHPIAAIFAILTTLPGAVNAFCMLANIKVSELSTKIYELSPGMVIASALMAIVSVIVNTSMNSYFLPTTLEKLKENLSSFCTLTGFPPNMLYLFAGAVAFLAAFAISYGAFAAISGLTGQLLGTIFGLINAFITFCTRYNGLPNLIKRFKDLFDANMQLKEDAIDKIKYLKEEFLSHLAKEVFNSENIKNRRNEETQLSEDERVILTLLTELDNLLKDYPEAYQKPTSAYILEYAGTAFDWLFALSGAFFMFPTFAQSGFNGVNIFAKNNEGLTRLSQITKILIGACPGLVSSIFYFYHLLDFRRISLRTYEHLKEHPEEILGTIIWAIMCLLSGSLLQNVSNNIVNIPNTNGNIFGFHKNSFSTILVWMNLIFPAAVNSKVVQNNALTSPVSIKPIKPQARTMEDDEDGMRLTREGHVQGTIGGVNAEYDAPILIRQEAQEPLLASQKHSESKIKTPKDAINYLTSHRPTEELAAQLSTLGIFSDYKTKIRQRHPYYPNSPKNTSIYDTALPQPDYPPVLPHSNTEPDFRKLDTFNNLHDFPKKKGGLTCTIL